MSFIHLPCALHGKCTPKILTIQISEIYNSIDNDEYCREKQGTAEGIRRVDRVRGIETLNRELLLDTLRR